MADESEAQASSSRQWVVPKEWSVGFDGRCKLGQWTPARCRLTIEGPLPPELPIDFKLRISAVDPAGNTVWFDSKPASVSEPGDYVLTSSFQTGKPDSPVTLQLLFESKPGEFVEGETHTFSKSRGNLHPLNLGERLVVTLGDFAGVNSLDADQDSEPVDLPQAIIDAEPVESISIQDQFMFPTDYKNLQSVDCIVLSDPTSLNVEQQLAFKKWVVTGGRAVFSLGKNAEKFRSHPITEWSPISIGEMVTLRELTGIESYVGRSDRIPMQGGVSAVLLSEEDGVTLAKSLSGPLIMRAPFGLGHVTVISVDINAPPFIDAEDSRENWPALPLLCWQLCELGRIETSGQETRSSQLTQSGVSDLKTQLLAANDSLFEVQRPAVWTVLALLMAYLLIVGPLDYLLVHKILRRPELTWISLPAWVIGACFIISNFATQTNGNELRISMATIRDVDLGSGTTHSRKYISVYSPESKRYDVAAKQSDDASICWTGVPENGFGGMYRSAGISFGSSTYEIKPSSVSAVGLPIPIWSSAHLLASELDFSDKDSSNDTETEASNIFVADVQSTASGQLRGTIRHRFDGKLVNWVLAYGDRVYHPDPKSKVVQSIPPNQTWALENSLIRQRELKGYLTGTRAMSVKRKNGIGEDVVVLQEDYDPLNFNVTNITRFLTFYEKVGGKQYTGLTNAELHHMDLTGLLELNRAVFVAEVDRSTNENTTAENGTVNVDGKSVPPTGQTEIVRIIIPVEQRQRQIKVLPKFDN